MHTHEVEKSTGKETSELFFSNVLLPPRLQGWVLLIVALLMVIDGIRLLFQR